LKTIDQHNFANTPPISPQQWFSELSLFVAKKSSDRSVRKFENWKCQIMTTGRGRGEAEEGERQGEGERQREGER
jgi:hypothetical protein